MPVNREIKPGSKKHSDILQAVLNRRDYSKQEMSEYHESWRKAEEKAVAYLPETEVDKKRAKKRDEGKPQYTTIQIPYSYALLMTAHTYWSSVFLSRTPILQFTARHGETQNAVMGVEALMDYQVKTGGMTVPFYIWLYDVGKYGLGIVGCYWDEEEQQFSELVKKPKEYMGIPIPGTERKVKQTRRIKGYQGNKLFNVRPYDWINDPRVSIKRFQEGEFCGRRADVGWNDILKGQESGRYINVEALKDHRARQVATQKGERVSGSEAIKEPDVEGWAATLGREDLQTINVVEMVIELSPKEWELGDSNYPEKWLFSVANDEVIIEARPLGYAHNRFPFEAIEYEPDGYTLASRGIMQVNEDLNEAMTWLFNQHFFNVRRALNDQWVADPSRVVMKDLMSKEPGKIVRAKPSAYGQDIRQMVQQFPIQDVTRSHIQDSEMVATLMQRITGITDNIMGQVNEKGRKTATEIRSTTSASLNRLKNNAEFFSAMGFEPLSQQLVQNTQQFMENETMVRIAGNNMRDADNFMEVSPEDITGFFDLVPVDGTLPVDRYAMANLMREMISEMVQIPEMAQSYDFNKMYERAFEMLGVRNMEQFRIEVQDDATLQQQAQQGNSIPLNGQEGGPSGGGDVELAEREAARPREPGQIPGMGASG